MSCGISPRCAMSRIRVIGTAQVNSSEKDGSDGKIRRAMKSSASPLEGQRVSMVAARWKRGDPWGYQSLFRSVILSDFMVSLYFYDLSEVIRLVWCGG